MTALKCEDCKKNGTKQCPFNHIKDKRYLEGCSEYEI